MALNPVSIVQGNADVSNTNPLPVTPVAGGGGAITWTKSAVTANGSSQTFLAANANRKAFIICSAAANAAAAIDHTGGTASLTAGLPLNPGQCIYFSGGDCPTNAITGIGTNTQTFTVYEGV